jgi:MoaD family protein
MLREITGTKEEVIQIAGKGDVTVASVLNALSNKYGKQFDDYVYDEEKRAVKGFLQFFINGQSASAKKGLETKLQDGDVLAIIPPVGGG